MAPRPMKPHCSLEAILAALARRSGKGLTVSESQYS